MFFREFSIAMVEKTTSVMEFLQRLNRNRLSPVGILMLGFIFVLCPMTPWLPLPDPYETDLANRLKTPLSSNHWLGTDELGRDLFSRLLWGT